MALLIKKGFVLYNYLFQELADPRAESLPLLKTPFPTILILILYQKFSYDWGPKFMANRKPYNIKNVILWFNIIQVIINSTLTIIGLKLYFSHSWLCQPINWSWTPEGFYELHLTYIYYLLKISDLADTVFFILKKNYRQVTFLHTYHHFGMVLITWVASRFVPGGHGVVIGLVNCFVHSVMYFYYLLSVYDPSYKKSIRIKKLITQLQLTQFMLFLIIFGRLLFVECSYPKIVSFFFVPQNLFMFVLFSDFYYKTYIRKKAPKVPVKEE
ncbi:elongation of very long chain fatty acids protein AAEL008004 [Aethina tumida]|uniref:elongation of very long chain fatty acids protein AAEL008004 n=1 Tax=Aethina tumida TaxID=116153 RepID=UPI00096ADCBE|nr:elongation of very long chain fatty acids protein AAEL008004 [Aethina tumida]